MGKLYSTSAAGSIDYNLIVEKTYYDSHTLDEEFQNLRNIAMGFKA